MDFISSTIQCCGYPMPLSSLVDPLGAMNHITENMDTVHLNASNLFLDDTMISLLANKLPHRKALQCLDISGCPTKIPDESMLKLLGSAKWITSLNADKTRQHVHFYLLFASESENLQALSLAQNQLGTLLNQLMSPYCSLFNKTVFHAPDIDHPWTLKHLNLSENGFDERHVFAIAELLAYLQLETLDLSYNPISRRGLNALMPALQAQRSLSHLSLAYCNLQGSAASLPSLLELPGLEYLDLSGNQLDTTDIANFFQKLNTDKKPLKGLYLNANLLGTTFCDMVLPVLTENTTLQVLTYNDSKISAETTRHIMNGHLQRPLRRNQKRDTTLLSLLKN